MERNMKTNIKWHYLNEDCYPGSSKKWKKFRDGSSMEILHRCLIVCDDMGEDIVSSAYYSSKNGWRWTMTHVEDKNFPKIKLWAYWPEAPENYKGVIK
jgi:hypothetical protein